MVMKQHVSEQNVVAAGKEPLASLRWARLMPLVFVSYSLAYLDRVNYGFGAAGGLAKTLGITPFTSAWLALCFSWDISFFRYPARVSPSIAARRNLSSGRYSP